MLIALVFLSWYALCAWAFVWSLLHLKNDEARGTIERLLKGGPSAKAIMWILALGWPIFISVVFYGRIVEFITGKPNRP